MASQGNPNPGRSRRDPWPFPTPGLKFLPQMRGVMLPEVAAVGIWSLHWGLEGIPVPSPTPKPPAPKPTGTRDGCAHLAVGPASCRHRRELSTSPLGTLGPLSPNLSGHKATNPQTARVSAFSLIFFFLSPTESSRLAPAFIWCSFHGDAALELLPASSRKGRACAWCVWGVCACVPFSPVSPDPSSPHQGHRGARGLRGAIC